ERGVLRLGPGLGLVAPSGLGPLRAGRHVAEQRVVRPPHSPRDGGRFAAGGAPLLPIPYPYRGDPAARRSARGCWTVSPMSWRWQRGALAPPPLVAVSVPAAWAGRHLGAGHQTPAAGTGTIAAAPADGSVEITGRILERLVNEGDKVTRGQPLVRLDDSELAADVRRLEASLRSAQATLRDLEKGARPQEIEDARAAVSSAEATRSMTEREFQ